MKWTYITVVALAVCSMNAYCQEVTVESSVVHDGEATTESVSVSAPNEGTQPQLEEDELAEPEEVDSLKDKIEQMERELEEEI